MKPRPFPSPDARMTPDVLDKFLLGIPFSRGVQSGLPSRNCPWFQDSRSCKRLFQKHEATDIEDYESICGQFPAMA
jgi:hypothetical protein